MARFPQLANSPSPTNGQTLEYNQTSKRWVPVNKTGGSVGYADLPARSTLTVLYNYNTSSWPPRPTNRTDITVVYVGGTAPPTDYVANVDLWDKEVTL